MHHLYVCGPFGKTNPHFVDSTMSGERAYRARPVCTSYEYMYLDLQGTSRMTACSNIMRLCLHTEQADVGEQWKRMITVQICEVVEQSQRHRPRKVRGCVCLS